MIATESHGEPLAGRHRGGARRRVEPPPFLSHLAGLGTVIVIGLVVAVAAGLFRGSFTETIPVTVLSPRAGLVMNPDAKVKLHGVQVGKVASIESLPNGQAALHLAMDPAQIALVPSNVNVDIASTTVFGAKFIELVAPPEPSPTALHSGQVLDGQRVTVEINTVFQQLTSLLATVEPAKLNQTLTALGTALSGRGHKIGKMITDLDAFLTTLNPRLPTLDHELSALPRIASAYADAAPDLLTTVENSTQISQTIVDEQNSLDALLVSSIGLADLGNQVLGENREPLTNLVHLLLPTTDLTNEYHPALRCGIGGLLPLAKAPPLPLPGAIVSTSFVFGEERYRYPANLPKVAATGGPQCTDLPTVDYNKRPPYVVADVGANPWQYGNQGLLLNSDGLKQLLYGPLDGPPRNSAQIGQPG